MPEYDVFVSYAREDNQTGWVTRLCDRLIEDARENGDPVPNIFLDKSIITGLHG